MIIPEGAEVLMIPMRFLSILKGMAHGCFLLMDFPLPIICSDQVPEDQVWFVANSRIDNDTTFQVLEVISINGGDDEAGLRLLGIAAGSDRGQLTAASLTRQWGCLPSACPLGLRY